mgnify:CR=1 FL=1
MYIFEILTFELVHWKGQCQRKYFLQLLGKQSSSHTYLNFTGIYIEVVDSYGHRYGVNSKELKQMIKDVDAEIYNLKKEMTSLGMDDVSLMIFSDHGMTDIRETVDLNEILDLEDVVSLIPEGSTVKIWPKEENTNKVFIIYPLALFESTAEVESASDNMFES